MLPMDSKRPPNIDDLVSRVVSALPEGFSSLQADAGKNLRAALHAALAKLDLVTREEFDVQRAVLARTRARLEALEEQVLRLENELLGKNKS